MLQEEGVELSFWGTAWSRCQAEGMLHCSPEGTSVHPGESGGYPNVRNDMCRAWGTAQRCLGGAGVWVVHG